MESTEGGSPGRDPGRPTYDYSHRKASLSALDYGLDDAIGDAFRTVLRAHSEEPNEEAVEDDDEYNADDTVGNAFRSVMASTHHSPEPEHHYEKQDYHQDDYHKEEQDHEEFDLDAAIGDAFAEIAPQKEPEPEPGIDKHPEIDIDMPEHPEEDAHVHSEHQEEPHKDDDMDLDLEGAIGDAFKQFGAEFKEDEPSAEKDEEHASKDAHSDSDDLKGAIGDAFRDLRDLPSPPHQAPEPAKEKEPKEPTPPVAEEPAYKQHEEPADKQHEEPADDDDDLAGAIGDALRQISRSPEPKKPTESPELGAAIQDAFRELTQSPAQPANDEGEDDDLMGAIGDAFKAFPELSGPQQPAEKEKFSVPSPPKAAPVPAYRSPQRDSQARPNLPKPSAAVPKRKSDEDDLSSAISAALTSVFEQRAPSSSDDDLERAIGSALQSFPQANDETDLSEAIGDAFKNVFHVEPDHSGAEPAGKNDHSSDLDAELEAAIGGALRSVANEGEDQLKSIIADAFRSVVAPAGPEVARGRRGSLIQAASAVRTAWRSGVDDLSSVVEHAFTAALATKESYDDVIAQRGEEVAALVASPVAALVHKNDKRDRDQVRAGIMAASSYLEGVEDPARAILSEADASLGGAAAENAQGGNPSVVATLAASVLAAVSAFAAKNRVWEVEKTHTDSPEYREKVRVENRERKQQWRMDNAERNKDNDLRQRVIRRAAKIYGEEDSDAKRQWIEEEFEHRREKRVSRQKDSEKERAQQGLPEKPRDREMIDSLARDPLLLRPVTAVFAVVASSAHSHEAEASVTATAVATAAAAALYVRDHEVVEVKLVRSAVAQMIGGLLDSPTMYTRFSTLFKNIAPEAASYYPGAAPPATPEAAFFHRIAERIQAVADKKRPASYGAPDAKRPRQGPTLALPATSPFISNKFGAGDTGVTPVVKPVGGLRKPGSFQRPPPKVKKEFSPLY
ncbi:hypothetical protein DICA4_A01156 [Diutina catenulata]